MPRFLLPLLLAAPLCAQAPPTEWAMDEMKVRNGATFRGLVLDESPAGVRFRIVKRPPGRPTFTLTTTFTPAEQGKLTKASEADRKLLRERLAALDTDGSGERQRMKELEFGAAGWLGKEKAARKYEADQFVLVSGAGEDITRRAAVRLEKMYTAFGRVLPPRHQSARPTVVELADSLDDYKAILKATGVTAVNAAVFFPTDNRIVCGSDLKPLGEDLLRTRLHHEQQLKAADDAEKDLRKLYKKDELDRFLGAVRKEREKVAAAERENEAAFDTATGRVFANLYHEAFHSYAAAFVFPPLSAADVKAGKGTGELPRWLNEGLAQIFEDPIVEAGELRVGHADPDRLKRVKEALDKKADAGLVPLSDLLRSGREQFVAAHKGATEAADRNYLSAWAAAHYLAFDRKLIGTAELDDYLKAVNTGTDPAKAFEALTGREVAAFEKDWHEYLRKLQPDGSVKK